ncbi:putative porin [Flammeovirga agarivorans]|uniref:Putative porin n=1 Tax=Flammeovirga agarivorans TaxID=2726742 RepID=A0A7X8SL47_9BACT|nr:putative porin [Flammeovirga agarivorans]NLR92246.1 putative porin [Flammeovirga agarivorans]
MKKVVFILLSLLSISQFSYAQNEEEKDEDAVEGQEPNKEGVTLEQDSSWLKGPQTTWYLTKPDVYKIHFEEHMMDSSYTHLHRYDINGQNGYRNQTLGNNASPLKSYWVQPVGHLRQTMGITGYDLYAQNLDTWEYYNAYIPVTDFNGVVGQDNRGKIGGKIARNIDPYWAVGLLFQRYSEPYILGRDKISNSYNAQQHTGFGLNTRYESKNNKYKLLASFYQYFHEGPESGGLAIPSLVNDDTSLEDLFKFGRGQLTNYFSDGVSSFKWYYNTQLYHQYALVDSAKLQVFHELNRNHYRYQYSNSTETISTNRLYYDKFNDHTYQQVNNLPNGEGYAPGYQPTVDTNYDYGSYPYVSVQQEYLDNKLGIKSRLGPTFWSGYVQHRFYRYQQRNADDYTPIPLDHQLFVGGDVEFQLPKNWGFVDGHGEVDVLKGNIYNINAKLQSRFLNASFTLENTLAPMFTQQFSSVFMSWSEEKKPIGMQQFMVAPQLPLGEKGNISVFGEINNINDYIYYDKYARPVQHNENIAYSRYGSRFKVKLGHIQQIAEVVYTQNNNQDVMPTPDIFATYEISYVREFRDGMISVYSGFDTKYVSSFYGYAFNPVTQQYHLQNDYETEGYFTLDFFLNFKMRRCMAFVRVSDILNAVNTTSGYWASAGYMGPGFGVSYGVRWLMFE